MATLPEVTRNMTIWSCLMTSEEVIRAPMDGRANQWLATQVVDLLGK